MTMKRVPGDLVTNRIRTVMFWHDWSSELEVVLSVDRSTNVAHILRLSEHGKKIIIETSDYYSHSVRSNLILRPGETA